MVLLKKVQIKSFSKKLGRYYLHIQKALVDANVLKENTDYDVDIKIAGFQSGMETVVNELDLLILESEMDSLLKKKITEKIRDLKCLMGDYE